MRKQILGFLVIGGLAFFIDAGVLQFLVYLEVNPFFGRVMSILLAMMITWWFNRKYTFALKSPPTLKEFTTYMSSNMVGGVINWGIFSVILTMWVVDIRSSVFAIIPATLCSMIFNFLVMKFWIFKQKSS